MHIFKSEGGLIVEADVFDKSSGILKAQLKAYTLDGESRSIINDTTIDLLNQTDRYRYTQDAEKRDPETDWPDSLVYIIESIQQYKEPVESAWTIGNLASKKPTLSGRVWRGLLADYRDLILPTTEAPDAYHLFSFLAAFGSLIGRTAHVYCAGEKYGNLFTCLVGKTGGARKTTAINAAYNVLKPVDPEWRKVRAISSAEGLVALLSDEVDPETGEITRKVDKRLLVQLSELSGFLRKSKAENLAHVIPFLADAWDSPDTLDVPTRKLPLKATEPYLSILAASTPEWLEATLSERDIHGGLGNRILFVLGEPARELPLPPRRDKDLEARLAKQVAIIRHELKTGEHCLGMTQGCITLWEQFYRKWRKREWPDDRIAALMERVPDQTMKLAMLYGVMEGVTMLTDSVLLAAMDAMAYQVDSVQSIFGVYNPSPMAKLEARILDVVRNFGGKIARRELRMKLGGRIAVKDMNTALDSLSKGDIITMHGKRIEINA
jgi:hypothetical protein